MSLSSPTTEPLPQPQPVGTEPAERVLISGSHGLIGSELTARLRQNHGRVVRLVHGTPRQGEQAISWEPEERRLDGSVLEDFNAVIHLAGESIAGLRWTEQKKQRIRESRVAGTRLLAERLAALQRKPGVLVCASAMGYYGDRGEEVLTEESEPGAGFLPEVCQAWEAAADAARAAGIRVVHARFGAVLSPKGGMLKAMLPFFKSGLGGPVGTGGQFVSWISLDDAVRGLLWVMGRDTMSGPVNFVAPENVTNKTFAQTLGRVLKRPAILPVPMSAVRAALGEMADELLLASVRMRPTRLIESGFEFHHPNLEPALRAMLK